LQRLKVTQMKGETYERWEAGPVESSPPVMQADPVEVVAVIPKMQAQTVCQVCSKRTATYITDCRRIVGRGRNSPLTIVVCDECGKLFSGEHTLPLKMKE